VLGLPRWLSSCNQSAVEGKEVKLACVVVGFELVPEQGLQQGDAGLSARGTCGRWVVISGPRGIWRDYGQPWDCRPAEAAA